MTSRLQLKELWAISDNREGEEMKPGEGIEWSARNAVGRDTEN